jgi:hypothetical protein
MKARYDSRYTIPEMITYLNLENMYHLCVSESTQVLYLTTKPH